MEQEQYIVSARKYRPDNFGTLIGQDNIARTLKNSILRGQLAHAYLFCGPRGVGKTTTARIFAKMINCSNPSPDMEPCGECESCRSFAEGRSFCIHELDAASNNGVDAIKELMDQVRVPPQIGKYSVFIIDEVHMLSQAAFNAFLKTLEEPPAHAIFILATTEKHKILPTILSRCQTYDFNRITIDNIVKNLKMVAEKEGIKIDEDSLHVIAQKADGAMRDALTIFDQTVAFCGADVHYEDVIRNLNVLDYEYSFSLVDCFLAGDWTKPFLILDEILAKGFNALHFVAALSAHLRNLAVAKSGGLDSLLEIPDRLKERFREQASRCTMQFIYDALAITAACESGYRASTNPRLHIEFALMRLSYIVARPAASQQVQQPVAAAPQTAQHVAAHPAAPQVQQPVAAAPQTAQHVAAHPATPQPQMQQLADAKPVQQTVQNQQHAQSQLAASQSASQPSASTQPSAVDSQAQQHASSAVQTSVVQPSTVQTQPAAADQHEAAPRRRRSTNSALSINALNEEGNKLAAGRRDVKHIIPSDEVIREQWPNLAACYASSKQRLASLLQSTQIDINEEDGFKIVTFMVVNEAQKKWIEDNLLLNIEANLINLVKADLVKLRVRLAPDDEAKPKDPYMPSDKAKVLMTDNDQVRNLVKDLGLDVK